MTANIKALQKLFPATAEDVRKYTQKPKAKPLSGKKKVSFSHKEKDYSFDIFPKAKKEVYEGCKDLPDIKERVNAWLIKNLRNKKIPNNHTGWEITVNDNSIGKMQDGKLGIDKIKALTALEDIIRVGVWVGKEHDNKNREQVEFVHRFMSIVEIEGVIYPFGFTVRELTKNKENRKLIYSGLFIPKPLPLQ